MSSFKFIDKPCEDMEKVAQWISDYIEPGRYINHMHPSYVLWKLATGDTHANVSHEDFKRLMRDAGYKPADPRMESCEYHISSIGIRRRPNAKVRGWQASRADTWMTRMR